VALAIRTVGDSCGTTEAEVVAAGITDGPPAVAGVQLGEGATVDGGVLGGDAQYGRLHLGVR
jgi:hypothetical protein